MYTSIALLSDGKYYVIIPAPNCEVEARNLRPLRSELPAVRSDISNAMRGLEDNLLHMLVLDEVLGLELSNFSKKLKMEPGIEDDHKVTVAMSDDLRSRGVEFDGEEKPKKQNAKDTKVHLEAMVLRTKPEANRWLS